MRGLDRGDVHTGVVEAVVSTTMTLGLALRRAHPTLMFTIVAGSCLVQALVWPDALPSDVAFPFATYALAAWATDRRIRLAGLGVAVLGGAVAGVVWQVGPVGPRALVSAAVTGGVAVVAWIAGDLMRNRRAVLARLAAQNEALVRDREQREQLAAQRERSRIARDMHDVVAHGLSVIVVQADGAAFAARHADTWRRDEAAETLETLAATARAALAETRHLVGLLRPDDDARSDDYAPVAGLTDLPALVERLRDAGLDVHLAAPLPDPAGVPTETSLAAYRITQESLTNVLKHGGPGVRATVQVRRDADGLAVEVVDDGRGAAADAAPTGGSGVVGMRERASAVGGSLTAAPRTEGGFRVRAVLPLAEVTA